MVRGRGVGVIKPIVHHKLIPGFLRKTRYGRPHFKNKTAPGFEPQTSGVGSQMLFSRRFLVEFWFNNGWKLHFAAASDPATAALFRSLIFLLHFVFLKILFVLEDKDTIYMNGYRGFRLFPSQSKYNWLKFGMEIKDNLKKKNLGGPLMVSSPFFV